MNSYESMLHCALEAAREAGAYLRRAFHEGENPVDPSTEKRIRATLLGRYQEFGYRGGAADYQASRDPGGHSWLVSAPDCPRAFEEGLRGPSVSIALLRRGTPVLGVVNAFSWPDDNGDLFAWAEGMRSILRNGCPVASGSRRVPATMAVSGHADQNSRVYAALAAPYRFRAVPGLALRLALVAAGEAAGCHSPSGPGGHGYCAGHALLRAVGMELRDERGCPVVYSQEGISSSGAICAAGPEPGVHDFVSPGGQRLAQAPRDPEEPYDLVAPSRRRLISDPGLLGRALGCLLGQLAGDALGSLVEFETPSRIAARYPQGVRQMEDGGTHDTIAGQPTDDSEMALVMARAILQQGCYDSEAAARAYCWWHGSGPFDIGSTVAAALGQGAVAAQQPGTSVSEACRRAANLRSEANGALMRVAPLGILGAGAGAERASHWADEDSLLTHPNPVCRHANSIFAASLAFAIGQGADARATYEFALAEARRIRAGSSLLDVLKLAAMERPHDYVTSQGHVIIALQNAFYQALHAPSLEDGIADTIMRGGDTDTNAAIAGALLGAIHGRAAIPFQWLDRLLTCRPIQGIAGVRRPRPKAFWPVDAPVLAEQLLWLGRQQT